MQVCLSPFYIPSGGMNFENTIAHFALGRDPRLKFPANLSSPLVFTALKHFQHLVDISSQPTLRRTNASRRRLFRAFIALFSNFQLFIFRTRSSLFFFYPYSIKRNNIAFRLRFVKRKGGTSGSWLNVVAR